MVDNTINKAKAKMLLDTQPVGTMTPYMFTPWAVRVLCFLLNRYIKGD